MSSTPTATLFTQGATSRRGAALLIVVVLFMLGSLTVTLGIGRTVYQDVIRHRELLLSKQAFFVAEAGVEDVIHRLRIPQSLSDTETLSLNGAHATTTVVTTLNERQITGRGEANSRVRTLYTVLSLGGGASFSFGLQSGVGGIEFFNSSSVAGNVYSNGAVTGAGGNLITGDVISAGPSGLITGVHATGSAYAHNITSATIDDDVYYAGGATPPPGVTVGGTTHTGAPDQPFVDFPITDELIDDLKQAAEDGGVIDGTNGCTSGTYTIDTSTSIGPVKIACNFTAEKKGGGTTITLTGPVWITGNFDTKSGPTFTVDPSLVDESIAIIVDNPSNQLTSSKVTFDQSGATFNSAPGNSYVLVISQNDSAENGGSEIAISAQQNLSGKVLLYASHGLIELKNSASLKEVTGYKIQLRNTAKVTYESGLASVLFTGGPTGGYEISSWNEIE